jgi:hypothetical protein
MSKLSLILHPQDNIKDILLYTGIVRYLYETQKEQIVYFVTSKFEGLLKKHFHDLDNLQYEVLDDFSTKSVFKFIMGKYKDVKIRNFLGSFDKFRLDNKKNLCQNYDTDTFNPYTLYGFDNSIQFTHFKTNCYESDDVHLLKMIKSIANWDYRIFSNRTNIPAKYKKNSVIALHVDKVFKETNFFDSIILMEKTKFIHFTDSDDFGIFVYLLFKSNKYEYLFDKTKVFVFYKGDEPKYSDYPSSWNVIKYIPE